MSTPVKTPAASAGGALREQLITIIGAAVVAVFVAAWAWVLWLVWAQPPGADPVTLGGALVATAGALSTTVATLTASALGFTIADVKNRDDVSLSVSTVGKELSKPAAAAILAYLIVGLAVLVTWVVRESVAPELVVTFGFSILGWLVGGASAAFGTKSP